MMSADLRPGLVHRIGQTEPATVNQRWEWTSEDIPVGAGPISLQATWAPLLMLTPVSAYQPFKFGNIGYLLDRLANPRKAQAVRSFPLVSFLSRPGMRHWIALRAGRIDLAFLHLPKSKRLGVDWPLLQECVKHFRKLSTGTKSWVITDLSQLILYKDGLNLAQGLVSTLTEFMTRPWRTKSAKLCVASMFTIDFRPSYLGSSFPVELIRTCVRLAQCSLWFEAVIMNIMQPWRGTHRCNASASSPPKAPDLAMNFGTQLYLVDASAQKLSYTYYLEAC